ncbi:MAG: DUF4421 domain-containing protein [Bacteroidales bacterium]|nr:DUF4421 domain-containing protein [Bacteroidales bacterium]
MTDLFKQFVKILILSFTVVIISEPGYPQYDSLKTHKWDTVYIKDLSDRLAIRIYGINKFSQFDIKDNHEGETVEYSPNQSMNLGVAVNYKWFGLGLAFNFPFINNDNDIYGKTSRFDIQTSIFTRSLAIDIYVQRYQGFYIENPEIYKDDWEMGMPYPQRPDIGSTTIGGSCIYTFKHKKYSAKAAFIQTELQKKSAGSFLLGGFFYAFSLSGDSAFVPSELAETYNPDLLFNRVNVIGIGISFGYTHTFVLWKKFYLSFTLVPGVSVQNYEVGYDDLREPVKDSFLSGRFLGRAAFVYNSERSFGGLTVSNDSFSGNTGKDQKNSMNYEVGVVRLFYGRRFRIK